MAGPKLYEVADEIRSIIGRMRAVEDAAEAAGGELTGDQENELVSLEAELNALGLTMEAKADAIASIIAETEVEAESVEALARSIRDQAARVSKRARSVQGCADRLRRYLKDAMEAAGTPKIKTQRFTISVQANSPSFSWGGPNELIPEQFRKASYSLDTAACRAALKQGEDLGRIDVHHGRSLHIR